MREAIFDAVNDINSSRGSVFNVLELINIDFELFKLQGEIEQLNLNNNNTD